MDPITDTDWAYLAGVLDGEGSLGVYNGQPRIVVAMATEQPCKWIFDTFGGCYKAERPVKRGDGGEEVRWTWAVYSFDWCQALLEGCLPYLTLKSDDAERMIKYCASK